MERLIGLILIVLAIWVGVEVYTKGMDGAFGGLFGSGQQAEAPRSAPQRAGDAFQRAYDKSVDRVERQLGEQHGDN